MTKTAYSAGVMMLLLTSSAEAQLWRPLDLVPRPNVVIGLDSSVTMSVSEGPTYPPGICGYECHTLPVDELGRPIDGSALPLEDTRLEVAKRLLREALTDDLDESLNVGAFNYTACDSARIAARSTIDTNNPTASLDSALAVIDGAEICHKSERDLPESSTFRFCLTPGCTGDDALVAQMFSDPAFLPGFTYSGLNVITCDDGTVIDLAAELRQEYRRYFYQLASALEAPSMANIYVNQLLGGGWERWKASLRVRLDTCLADPSSVYDAIQISADAGRFQAEICLTPWAASSCICGGRHRTDPSCFDPAVLPEDRCGVDLRWSMRQRVAVCEFIGDETLSTSFGATFAAQPDNVASGNPDACRENVGILVTDGAGGNSLGMDETAQQVLPIYSSPDGLANLFVFHVAAPFWPEARELAITLSDGQRTIHEEIRQIEHMQFMFARVANRAKKGVYSGSAPAMDRLGQRIAYTHFLSPGYNRDPALPSDDYFGYPAYLSWHSVDAEGNVSEEPLWETDWQQVAGTVGTGGPANNPIRYLCPGATTIRTAPLGDESPCVAGDRNAIGPGGVFPFGRSRTVLIGRNAVDRDGDRIPDTHPPLRYGNMMGPIASQPVIVSAPIGAGTSAFLTYAASDAIRGRPQVAYVLSNGYLHAIHAGEPVESNTTFGALDVSLQYDDSPLTTQAGREIFRYRPPWLDSGVGAGNMIASNALPRALVGGQISVREVELYPGAVPAEDAYATLLVMNQGPEGRGFSALDVTNPFEPRVVAELTLPAGEKASSEALVHPWPGVSGTRLVVPMATGTDTVRLWNINDNTATTQVLAGDEYHTPPVCISLETSGVISVCYVLGRFGTLWRLPATSGGFGPAVDVTPAGAEDVQIRGDGREYWTRPVVFFDTDNSIGLAFGSGKPTDPTDDSVTANRFFRLRDRGVRGSGEGLNESAGPLTGVSLCRPSAEGDTLGQIELGSESLFSPPSVRRGTIAFATYLAGPATCGASAAHLYSMDYRDCSDVAGGTAARPVAQEIGYGMPATPQFHLISSRALTQTSKQVRAGQTDLARLMARRPLRFLYWRLLSNQR